MTERLPGRKKPRICCFRRFLRVLVPSSMLSGRLLQSWKPQNRFLFPNLRPRHVVAVCRARLSVLSTLITLPFHRGFFTVQLSLQNIDPGNVFSCAHSLAGDFWKALNIITLGAILLIRLCLLYLGFRESISCGKRFPGFATAGVRL